MQLLIDFLCVLILALFFWWHRKHTLFSAGTAVVCDLIAFVVALFVSVPLGRMVDERLIAPVVRTHAANDIADMYSVEHQKTPEETVQAVDLDQLFADEPQALVDMADRHQQSLSDLRKTYRLEGAEAFLNLLTGNRSMAFSRALSFGAVFAVLALVLRSISKRLEENFPPAVKYRGFKKILAMTFGLMVGIVMVTAISMILSWTIPYGAGRALFLDDVLWKQSFLYQLTSWLHIF